MKRLALPTILLAAGALLASGCVYKMNIQQGNYLVADSVSQLKEGMTRSQVRYLLGTPMISDPFEAQRWDYIYTLKHGHRRKLDRSHFVVYFAEDKVTKVDKLDLPDTSSVSGDRKQSRKQRKAAEAAVREPPPAPSVSTPQPDTPRPGSERY